MTGYKFDISFIKKGAHMENNFKKNLAYQLALKKKALGLESKPTYLLKSSHLRNILKTQNILLFV